MLGGREEDDCFCVRSQGRERQLENTVRDYVLTNDKKVKAVCAGVCFVTLLNADDVTKERAHSGPLAARTPRVLI